MSELPFGTNKFHTNEWWEGYSYMGPRNRNPYQGSPEIIGKSQEWLAGWLARFFGEIP